MSFKPDHSLPFGDMGKVIAHIYPIPSKRIGRENGKPSLALFLQERDTVVFHGCCINHVVHAVAAFAIEEGTGCIVNFWDSITHEHVESYTIPERLN